MILAVALLVAFDAPTATRLVRFFDEAGRERLGHVEAEVLARLAQGGGGEAAVCCEDAGGLFGARRLTGERARVTRLLAPVPKPPAIYGIGQCAAKAAS